MQIIIDQGYKRYTLKVELIRSNEKCECYKVYPPEAPDKYLVIENNKPLIRGKYKLKKRRIDWKQTEGRTVSAKTLQEIIKRIENPPIDLDPDIPIKATLKRKKTFKGAPLSERMKNKDASG